MAWCHRTMLAYWKFESISLQRRVFANLTRSIRSPKILPSELRAASVIRVYVARAVSWRGPGGEVRRLTDDRLVLRRAFADQIADDHQPGGDPDARLELRHGSRSPPPIGWIKRPRRFGTAAEPTMVAVLVAVGHQLL